MTTYQQTNAVAGSTREVTTVRYTAKTHTSGGRRGGASSSDDGHLDVRFSAPGVPGAGANPEQLFAAGWSACFISAMGIVANKMNVKLPADAAIDAEIDLCNSGGVYFLRARLNVSLPGLQREVAKVGPHGNLPLEFPYVGPPHQSRVTKAPHKTTATQNQK